MSLSIRVGLAEARLADGEPREALEERLTRR
jgi:hypothetical protein